MRFLPTLHLAGALVASALFGTTHAAASTATEVQAEETRPWPALPWNVKFFPIPMYTTVPTEGSTYGVMPVFLGVDGGGVVKAIAAPSLSWNSAAGVTGTLRLFYYASTVRALSVIAAASTHVNRTLWVTYTDLPGASGRSTLELEGKVRRNIFYRFFGFGPESRAGDQSSYTQMTASLSARWGVNLPGHLNVGARGILRGDRPQRNPIFDLPATQDLFPDAPGLAGAGLAGAEASLRFDTRAAAEYSETGLAAELSGSYNHGLGGGFDHFWRVTWQTQGLLRETARLQTAARLYWTAETSTGAGRVPFYYQSALGGEAILRGFPEDRFVDRAAWEGEAEQRIRLFETHIFGVATDWRVDPFLAVGQVYGQLDDIAVRPQVAFGLGLRAWVKPNVLGRVDVAYAGEGVNAYVVLGYPY